MAGGRSRGATTATPAAAPRRPGRPPRSEQERAAQRARLLDAAMAAIRDGGPDLSIDELAAAAGVSKPVLYDEFGGKVGMADAMAVVLTQRVEREVLDELAKGPAIDAETSVRLAVTALIDLIADEPNIYAFLVRSMRSNDRGFLDNALVREMHARATVVVRLAAPDVDQATLRVLTDGLFGFLFGAVESWQATRKPPKAKLVDGLTRIIVTGLQAATSTNL
jgi:AcrR family transcriptional regulator